MNEYPGPDDPERQGVYILRIRGLMVYVFAGIRSD
jgi:hypothetical protein